VVSPDPRLFFVADGRRFAAIVAWSGLQSDCIGPTALDYWFYAISEPSDDSI
jgi:hypothetical protein